MSTPHADTQLAAVDIDPTAASAYDTPLGITNPPIDELLDRASSKYALVIYAAKRARQINDYYNQLGDGILEYVGPLVEPGLQEKPLSIAHARDPRRPARAHRGRVALGLRASHDRAQADHRRRRRWHRRLQGVHGGPPAHRGRSLASGWSRPSPRCDSSAPPPSRRCPGNPVHTGVFDDVHEVPHVRIGQEADLVVVAPATADLLARAVAGRADDLLTATLLTARCPVLFAPAMHTEMWLHPATVDNVATLRRRGAVVLEPASGRLTGADTGAGPAARGRGDHHAAPSCCSTAPTRCRTTWPASRCWSPPAAPANRSTRCASSATAAPASRATRWPGSLAQRGADVTLIAGNTAGLVDPAGVDVVHVGSAAQLRDAVSKHAPDANVLVMAAAVADFRPDPRGDQQDQEGRGQRERRPPSSWSATTTCSPARCAPAPTASCPTCGPSSGFAAETGDANGDVLFHARAKLQRKGCDLLVVNAVGDGRAFEVDHNDGWLLAADGTEAALEHGSKTLMASRIVDAIVAFLRARRVGRTRVASRPVRVRVARSEGTRLGAEATRWSGKGGTIAA